ncbi:ABC transporter ATP-binding protein [Psychroflexus sediminis]|uniref:Peptide/nickel transport system ATP-binding protein n=1 Tax=Psychroflexus sediminis TaxID=470826 RepID=A0A1G7UF64_9FLAO|nr:ABC transporter ATP-binding protein [Psychroflexus sediminis]SDG46097.1 peptide/nickel transport system ATP-binding protein [Psychroflexus sediminis]
MLKVSNLNIHFGDEHVIKNVSFNVQPNQILGIVGESGSGKSVSTLSILGLLGPKAKVQGSILFQKRELTKYSEQQFQQIRGNDISMIFQEPMSSLNPSMRCGKQVEEVLIRHKTLSKKEVRQEVLNLFEKVKLPRPEAIFKSYPHQISGGQKQRVMIAMAIACKPKILIADEPTTALDVTVQKEILKLLKSLQQETEMSIIFISHDLALVSELADRVAVMYQGEIVEQNDVVSIFKNASHQYTKALLASKPSTRHRLKALPTVKDYMQEVPNAAIETSEERKKRHELIYSRPPLLEVKNVKKTFISNAGWFEKSEKINAVDDVSFKIYEGETLGLVGESGCGKSTLGNAILRLDDPTEGDILYQGKSITRLKGEALRQLRKDIQLIFQDPFSSLNPRLSVGKTIMEPMKVHGLYGNAESRRDKTIQILERVGLSEEHFDRYPHEFSGGQRQRIGIARTIAVEPKLIICDESVSALDISVQAQVLNLLNELKTDFGFTYIFISHDLAVVKYMADQLLVMHQGKIVERGEADAVYAHPEKDYTKELIEAIPKGI